MKKVLNILLFISFVATIMAPVKGIYIHKLAATVLLLLNIIHLVVYRHKLGFKRWLLLATILISFISGLYCILRVQNLIILNIHRTVSTVLIFFLAIHIFVFYKTFLRKNDKCEE